MPPSNLAVTVIFRLLVPCEDEKTGIKCAPPYGFHNQLSLTEDTSQFKVSDPGYLSLELGEIIGIIEN